MFARKKSTILDLKPNLGASAAAAQRVRPAESQTVQEYCGQSINCQKRTHNRSLALPERRTRLTLCAKFVPSTVAITVRFESGSSRLFSTKSERFSTYTHTNTHTHSHAGTHAHTKQPMQRFSRARETSRFLNRSISILFSQSKAPRLQTGLTVRVAGNLESSVRKVNRKDRRCRQEFQTKRVFGRTHRRPRTLKKKVFWSRRLLSRAALKFGYELANCQASVARDSRTTRIDPN